jgi:hypothetical protein
LRFHPRLGRAARFRLRVRAAAPTGQPESGSPLVHSPISSVRLPQSARSLSSSRVLASRDRVGDIAIVSPPPDGRRTALEWRDRRRHFLFAEPRARPGCATVLAMRRQCGRARTPAAGAPDMRRWRARMHGVSGSEALASDESLLSSSLSNSESSTGLAHTTIAMPCISAPAHAH